MIHLLWVALAFAQDPTVTSAADGTVTATVDVAASAEKVRACLADAEATSKLTPEVIDAEATPKGACEVVDVTSQGAWNPFTYKALRCPTKDGWTYELLQSEDFEALHIEWKVTPTSSGSTVEYKVKTDLAMSLPSSVVQPRLERSARATLMKLVEAALR
jgi:uncharacterized protein YndB with AHSA1/START domain